MSSRLMKAGRFAEIPGNYRNAIVKTAELCTVKKVIMDPPEFEITAHLPQVY